MSATCGPYLEALVAQQADIAAGEIALAVQRRRDAMRRAARAREGLPQVANGKEGVDPDVIARIEAEIESSINLTDVGIEVFIDPETGKTTYRTDVSVLKLNPFGSKQQQLQQQQAAEEEEEEEKRVAALAAKPRSWKGIAAPRFARLATKLASLGGAKKPTTNEDAAFLVPLKREVVDGGGVT